MIGELVAQLIMMLKTLYYTPLSLSVVTLTFSPTNVEQTQCVNVTVFGDRIVESNETVNVTFHIQYPLDSMNGSLYFSANIIIVDDDGKNIYLNSCS